MGFLKIRVAQIEPSFLFIIFINKSFLFISEQPNPMKTMILIKIKFRSSFSK